MVVVWEEYDPNTYFPFSNFPLPENSPFPVNFQLPRIEPYDGSSDPDDHLKAFYVHMNLYHFEDNVFCRAFPCTLTGPALHWFFTLTPNSINSFSQLSNVFVNRFKSSKTCINLPTTLTCLKQRDDESLKDYVDRFKLEADKVDHISSRDYLRLVEAGFKQGRFKESLVKKPVRKLDDFWKRAKKFVDVDDNDKQHQRKRGFFKKIGF
jgi:hypothetical protein